MQPSRLLERILRDPLTTQRRRRAMLIFRGRRNQLPDDLTSAEQARLALLKWDLEDPALEVENGRLAALDGRLGQTESAEAARERARELGYNGGSSD
ncbi:MAG: hypothetical protein ACLFVN_00670 [Phycisphaeraceae bacterium]